MIIISHNAMGQLNSFVFLMWPQHAACGILVSRPGIEPTPSIVKTQNPKHLTPRGVPKSDVLIYLIIFDCISTLVASLFPNQGSNPDPWQVRVQSPNHWTTREFPEQFCCSHCGCVQLVSRLGCWPAYLGPFIPTYPSVG